VSRRARAPVT